MPDKKILVLCDKDKRCSDLCVYLEDNGYQLICNSDYQEVPALLTNGKLSPQLMILGVDLPGEAEYELLDHIREFSDLPVIMIAKDDRLDTQLYAYSRRIDDYMTLPLAPALAEAHIAAVLRRTGLEKLSVIRAGALTIDYESRKIYLRDQMIRVTAKEFDLMVFFVQHRGVVLSRDRILDAVWGFDYVGGYRSVDTLVKKLRAKLTREYPYIQTVYGVGYCFDV